MTKFSTNLPAAQEIQEYGENPREPHPGHPGQVDITAVIVSWNVRDLLIRCLEALCSNAVTGSCSIEVIVVDNASHDGSVDAATTFDGVRVIQTGANLGYGKANNIGLQEAGGRYMLVLNPDVLLQPGALTSLVTFADKHQTAGIIAPRLLNQDGSVQSGAFRFPSLSMALLDQFPLPNIIPGRLRQQIGLSRWNGRYSTEQIANKPYRIDHPLGACMLLRREAYRQAGGFDPNIFMYSEEIDLALRYRQAGWLAWQVPAARAVHLGGASTKQVPAEMMVELWRSRLYLYQKHRGRLAYLALCSLLLAAQLFRATDAKIAHSRGRISKEEATKQFWLAQALCKLALVR